MKKTILPPAFGSTYLVLAQVHRMQVAIIQGDNRIALAAYYDAQRQLDECARLLKATVPATPEAKR